MPVLVIPQDIRGVGCPLALWNIRPRWEASYVVTPPDMQGPEGPGILSRARYVLQGPRWGLEIPGSVSEEREERENHRPVIWLTLLRLTSRRVAGSEHSNLAYLPPVWGPHGQECLSFQNITAARPLSPAVREDLRDRQATP